ncbi:alcohol dehydrogenase catalytic domain-containing protein [Halolamina sp. CBA1230]|uniref:alcohol dehydrogenase catalytic domain-containing protein n=1 Tax=Halolamina sp. CBA1230 TaxID=1853690 RepID=UPI0009A20425|nr:alcohol dehydrogenase catalytic domain-containing protein [Halolamina sp. CBA1230]QKY21464.1 alcohol dehydrogenase catalytic domain-containing protein [Halolamina sp. CBA1230]
MDAVVLRENGTPRLVDRPRPDPGPGEALVRIDRVGIDGTDREVLDGAHGDVEESMVLGHEAVGTVAEPNGTGLETDETVVPTVRRPPGAYNEYFRRGEPDMAPMDATVECGIDGADGFMAEYVAVPSEYLVPLPDRLAPYGFLVEPLSITAKALELASASREPFTWDRDRALVLGTGSLGLLTVPVLAEQFDAVYCLGRRDRDDPGVELAIEAGATYVDSRETPVDEIPEAHAPMDLVVEATGHPPHAVESVAALAPNGVAALLGVPEAQTTEVDLGAFHRELVLGNRAMVGSVNAGYTHFERAIEWLDAMPASVRSAFTEHVYPVEQFEAALDSDVIKAAVEIGP